MMGISRGRMSGFASIVAAVAIAISLAGCADGSERGTVDYAGYLFMSDTNSGNLYTYDPATKTASTATVAVSTKNAGEIGFFGGIGYACVGSGSGEGIYYFNPQATNPSCARIGASIAAQYVAFYSTTKAYVSAYDYSGTTSGLYSFDPSRPSSGLTSISDASGRYLQDLIIAPDGYLYAADNGNRSVIKVDPSTDKIIATYTATATGTTGLLAGSYDTASGVFVANTGGSIDFISQSGTVVPVVTTSQSSSIYPGRIVQLSNGSLVATGFDTNWKNHTYLVSLSGTSASVNEILSSGIGNGSSFGSLDIAYKDGLVYVPDYYSAGASKLYIFDGSGAMQSGSPLAVMGTGNGITNIAFYED